MEVEQRRRKSDGGWLCWVALRCSDAWEWIDKRQIDAHVVAAVVMWGTIEITDWAMDFAEAGSRPGMEVAAIIGAVMVPWSGLQAAVVKWYFEARR